MHLVKRILLTLLKLLLTDLNALVTSQTGILSLNLRQPSLLERRIRSLESSLRMPIHLAAILACKRQSVERIVDTRRIERRSLLAGRGIVELRQIQCTPAGSGVLLRGGFCVLGFAGLGGFFGGEEGVPFGLLACRFGFFGFGVFAEFPERLC